MLSILAVLAAPGHRRVAAGLGMGMATRHPGVWRWRLEPVDRPQEINATTSHTYRRHAPGAGLPLTLHQGSVAGQQVGVTAGGLVHLYRIALGPCAGLKVLSLNAAVRLASH